MKTKNLEEFCECNEGALGLAKMFTEDLQKLRIIMERAALQDERAMGTLFAVRYELRKRCIL